MQRSTELCIKKLISSPRIAWISLDCYTV